MRALEDPVLMFCLGETVDVEQRLQCGFAVS